ncbi:MAG TPA: NADH-quinone oxidoreductase subunit N [Sphingobacteriaceae bacterium]
MLGQDFYVLSPLLILACASVLIMLLIAMKAGHRMIEVFSLVFFALAFGALFIIGRAIPYAIPPLLIVDGFGVFIVGLIIFSGLVINVLSYLYFAEKEENPKEYYVLLQLATLGACVLAISDHFISLFLGLELLSVGLYGLIAYLRARHHPVEAGIKYLVLAAFSSAFLLFGMALIYFQFGSMEFGVLANKLQSASFTPLVLTGLGMMLVGIGFKLAIVPFHLWAADVYQGAPPPITAFIATASKGGVLAMMLRFFTSVDGLRSDVIQIIFVVIAIASMVMGNLLALQQQNVKRLLAYSSVAHLGYMLVAFMSSGTHSTPAVSFYLLTYFLSTLAAFGVVSLLSGRDTDAEYIADYRGLFWRRPLMACIFTAALLSLAGIPLTAGFIGKFYILFSGLGQGLFISCLVLVLSSVVGLYYYLRMITAMFSAQGQTAAEGKRAHPLFYLFSSVTLSAVTVLIVWLGVNPSSFMGFMTGLIGK